jgi:hypothetical protein
MMKQLFFIFFISLFFGGCFTQKSQISTATPEQSSAPLSDQNNSSAQLSNQNKTKSADKSQNDVPSKVQVSSTNTEFIDGNNTKIDSIYWIERIHQFGDVPSGPPALTKFIFINKGNQPVSISEVQAGCSCTATDYSKGLISPNDTGFVSASYKTSNTFGFFRKHIDVFFDHKDKKHHLILTGNVDPMRTK